MVKILNKFNECLKSLPNLKYDEACIDFINKLNDTVVIEGQYNECSHCNLQDLVKIKPDTNTSYLINTRYTFKFVIKKLNCSYNQQFYEHYRYGLNITNNCQPIYIKEQADNSYLPILSAFIVLSFVGTFWYMVKCIYKNSIHLHQLISRNNEIENDANSGSLSTPILIDNPPPLRKHSKRFKSIDVFRGLCVILMIFVNYGGGQYKFFKHSIWNGLTVADLVFPWFCWIMGMSIFISMDNKLKNGVLRWQLFISVIRRSIILILLGVIINSNHNHTTIASLRFPGVLQRLGITYFIVAIIEIIFSNRKVNRNNSLQDILLSWPQWVIVLGLTSIHICVTFLINVPNCGKGYVGPGGLHMGGKYYNCTGGMAGFIDRKIFGEHIYKNSVELYDTKVNYDPEGLLGTLTGVLIVYFGVQAGRILKTYPDIKSKIIRWLIWGFTIGLLGGILTEFKKDDGLIPVNKRLTSVSFVLILSGMAFIIETFLFLVVDIYKKWGGRPFFYPGMNALILYVGHELLKETFPFGWIPVQQTHGFYLFMNLWGTAVWVAIGIFLYKKNKFFVL